MNLSKLQSYIKEYKRNFVENFKDERYKWKAVMCFQKNWNIEADNFLEMYNNATKFERNLLTQSSPKLPKKMVNHFVDEGWEDKIKEAFFVLFDETKEINSRIDKFINIMNEINTQRNNKNQRNDISAHEDLNIASVYLWLKYPDKYYMYKPSVCENIVNALDCDFEIQHKRNKNANRINFEKTQEMYEKIQNEILKDEELQNLLKSNLNYIEEYTDEKYHILAQDIGYFINKKEEFWKTRPKVWLFAAGESAKLWDEFYKNSVMAMGWYNIKDLNKYKNKNELKTEIKEINNKEKENIHISNALWNIYKTISIGDIIYVKKHKRDVIARGIVTSNYIYDIKRIGYEHCRQVEWTDYKEYQNVRDKDFAPKTLTEITEDAELCKKLEDFYSQIWFPENYSPKFTVNDWVNMLNNPQIFDINSLKLVKRLYDIGNQASCKQLAQKYGLTYNAYIVYSVGLGQRIYRETNCPLLEKDNDNAKWWTIPFIGRKADKQEVGTYIWKLREELKKAIELVDLSKIDLYENGDNKMEQPLNQILYGPPGTGKTYRISEYVRKILKDSQIKSFNEQLNVKSNNCEEFNILDYPWYIAIAYTLYNSNNSLTVPELFEKMKEYIDRKNHKSPKSKLWQVLQAHASKSSITVHVSNKQQPYIFDKQEESKWVLTEEGKHFVEELIYNKSINEELGYEEGSSSSIANELNNKYVEFITFHQSYSYEEFVEGIKPDIDSSGLKYKYNKGIFKELCIRANSDPDNNYVLVIDEINRGNISKIFGELITLIEEDKRIKPNSENDPDDNEMEINSDSLCYKTSLKIQLPYTKQKFGVPNNLYIIGTMNTADRSIASVDIALRRRFRFVEMMPKPELLKPQNGDTYTIIDDKENKYSINLCQLLKTLNERISYLIDPDHQIGHSYFLKLTKDEDDNDVTSIKESDLKDVFKYEILPLLNEYFYGDWEKLQSVLIEMDTKENNKEIKINVSKSFIKEDVAPPLRCAISTDSKKYSFRIDDVGFDIISAIACIGKNIITPDDIRVENKEEEIQNNDKTD